MKYVYWDQYVTFHNAAIASNDIDPIYPVLKHLGLTQKFTTEHLMRAILLHVAYYDFGSALTALHHHIRKRVPFSQLPDNLPCGTERRGHRNNTRLRSHLEHLASSARSHGSFHAWVNTAIDPTGTPQDNFEAVTALIGTVYGNGRWAAYKTAEMIWKIADAPLEAATLDMDDATGPKRGLQIILPDEPHTEQTALKLIIDLAAAGYPAAPEQVETTLCDFHSLTKGKYYVGLSIDEMHHQLDRAEPTGFHRAAWAARAATIPRPYLGEWNNRTGIDTPRKKVFTEQGLILTRATP